MTESEGRPLQLIARVGEDKYALVQEGATFLRQVPHKLAFISIAGAYRTGKSFLLNKMLLNRKSGFQVGPTTQSMTKGLWIWSTPLVHKNDQGELINAFIIDSEGLGSTEGDYNHDLRLLSLALMLSSTFLYNTVGAIDENSIDSLGLILRLCEHLRSNSFADFPEFNWVLRDFSLQLIDKNNRTLTTKAYLENCLAAQAGDSADRNKIREIIKEAFSKRDCFAFVRPLMDESQLQSLDTMDLKDLRPEFVEQVLSFRKQIFSRLRSKAMRGIPIDGESITNVLAMYVEQINNGSLPSIQTGWNYVMRSQCQKVLDQLEQQLQKEVAIIQARLPNTRHALKEIEIETIKKLHQRYKSLLPDNEHADRYLQKLKETVSKKFTILEEALHSHNKQAAKQFIKKEFDSIEKKLKKGHFTDLNQFVRELQFFYEFYRKNNVYKDQIQTGLEFLLKKFADCALHIFKAEKTKSHLALTKCQQELLNCKQDNSSKEDKYKAERTAWQNQIAKLQSKEDSLYQQNKQIVIKLAACEEKMDTEIREWTCKMERLTEGYEHETIALRKKIIDCDQQRHLIENAKFIELNELKKQLALKESETKHLLEQYNSISVQIESLNHYIKSTSNQYKQKVSELETKVAEKERQKIKEEQRFVETLKQKTEQYQNNVITVEKYRQQAIIALKQKEEQLTLQKNEYEKVFIQAKDNLTKKQTEWQAAAKNREETLQIQIKSLQTDLMQRETAIKMQKMNAQRDVAVIDQQLEFIRREGNQKDKKIILLQSENSAYADLFEQKQHQIELVNAQLEAFKKAHASTSTEFTSKYEQLSQMLSVKAAENHELENRLVQIIQEAQSWQKKFQQLSTQQEQEGVATKVKLQALQRNYETAKEDWKQVRTQLERQVERIKGEHSRQIEEQQRSAELSVITLRNSYDLEKDRLEKKHLEERHRMEYNISVAQQEAEKKLKKEQRLFHEEIMELKLKLESAEEACDMFERELEEYRQTKSEEDELSKVASSETQATIATKYQDLTQEFVNFERSVEQERIGYIKRIQTLNYQLAKKEREATQANTKREAAQSLLAKKEAQVESTKRLMNQEVESSLSRVSEVQQKYQKLQQEYMQSRIAAEQQIGLLQQNNEYLNGRLAEFTKDKAGTPSYKNLDRLDKQKSTDLKDNIDKLKTENNLLQQKLETLKKTAAELQSTLTKEISRLERQSGNLKLRAQQAQANFNALQGKLGNKLTFFNSELEEVRAKHQQEKSQLQRQLEETQKKLSEVQSEVCDISWKMQKQMLLLADKIHYVEHQRDQFKKEMEASEQRLQIALITLKKINQKHGEGQDDVKASIDKGFSQHLQVMKESLRNHTGEQEELIQKLKQQIRQLKEKIQQQNQRQQRNDKAKITEKWLTDQIEHLKKQKQAFITAQRAERNKENEEWKKKLNDIERKLRQAERKNKDSLFELQKEKTKWELEKQTLQDKIESLESQAEWEKERSALSRSRLDSRKSIFSTGSKKQTEEQ